ncbi:MAG: Hsp70 family protein [Thermoanaerobaculaceae bacterium]
MEGWALDLGTTNSAIARWDEKAGQPQLVELPAICRVPEGDDPLEAPRLVPSAVHFLEDIGLVDRLGAWPPVARTFFWGRTALIGRPALERNREVAHPAFVPTFKMALDQAATRPLARVDHHSVTARGVARTFMRELLAEVKRATGTRIRDLVMTVPVSAFETYRAEMQQIARALGVRRLRFLDEPIAAALGYGLAITQTRHVLVVDIGGGTMHVALVRMCPGDSLVGQAEVLGKQVRPFGGHAVDGWVLMDLCEKVGVPLLEAADSEDTRFWRRLMLAEACRVKEAVYFDDEVAFRFVPLGSTRMADAGRPGSSLVTLTRERLVEILTANGYYRSLEACLHGVLRRGTPAEIPEDAVDEVLMVGGSTLLPGVYAMFESRFGRQRMRAWQPFEAVVHGAACFAAGRFSQLDFIVHDYAFVTHDPKTGEPQHTIIVPHGTRFPTPPDLWKRQVVPTCSLGEPETIFKLVICEIARSDGQPRRFVWDAAGELRKVGGATPQEQQVIVPLNESSPALGYLDPPHEPGDRRPRLEIAFGVNADRWLVATVTDLRTRKLLMDEEPVVRLV